MTVLAASLHMVLVHRHEDLTANIDLPGLQINL